MSFTSQSKTHGQDLVMSFDGMLDETSKMPQAPADLKGRLVLDLSKLTMINSLGCRKWIMWVRDLAKDKVSVVLRRCSPAIVHQINILNGFIMDHVTVESILVPYTCDSCQHEEQNDLTITAETTSHQVPEDIPCPKCGAQMNLDVLKERYLRFLVKK